MVLVWRSAEAQTYLKLVLFSMSQKNVYVGIHLYFPSSAATTNNDDDNKCKEATLQTLQLQFDIRTEAFCNGKVLFGPWFSPSSVLAHFIPINSS